MKEDESCVSSCFASQRTESLACAPLPLIQELWWKGWCGSFDESFSTLKMGFLLFVCFLCDFDVFLIFLIVLRSLFFFNTFFKIIINK